MIDQQVIRHLKAGASIRRDASHNWCSPTENLYTQGGEELKHQVSQKLLLRLRQSRKIIVKWKPLRWVWKSAIKGPEKSGG